MSTSERPEFVIATERVYVSFQSEMESLRQCSSSGKNDVLFRDVVISAYVKAYDFVRYICTLHNLQDAFFQLPMLRGICEDLITISYLITLRKEEKDYLLVNKLNNLKYSIEAQKSFFNKYNKGQITLSVPKDIQSELNSSVKLPTVKKMAATTGLQDLYSFIYHSTSKMVHFDVFTLLSMGWGIRKKESDTIEASFSYRHDYRHHYAFVLFYSSYLFIQQSKYFDSFLGLPESIKISLKELEDGYQKIDWPELITFSQMNIESPSTLVRLVFRAKQDK